jgi:hypothetical protein
MLIPTPGQPEQEYLAKHLSETGLFLTENQDNIDIGKIISRLENFNVGITLFERFENPGKRLPFKDFL